MFSAEEVQTAELRIRPDIRETPVERSFYLSRRGGAQVYLKLEHLQHTGSFKLRGAFNKLRSLTAEELQRGVIAASTGNHGLAVCYAAREVGTTATIYLPRQVSEHKLEAMRALGGETRLSSDDCLEAEIQGRAAAKASGQVFISPYNDREIIAGQGTIAVELARQLDRIDAVFVAVGGGGLISGVAEFLKSVHPATRIVGCWPEKARSLYECLRAGRVIEWPEEPTISESTAGGPEEGTLTLPLCQRLIDDHVLVSEPEIYEALRLIAEQERWIVEGAAGVAVAGFLKTHEQYAGQNVVIILCGRNLAAKHWSKLSSG